MKITSNRKAYFEYSVLESFDAGIKLIGNEVKSIRRSDVTIADSFVYIKNGELFIKNMKVAKYKQSHMLDKHDENREKKLLLNRREINKIEKLIQGVGTTIIPLEVFIYKNLIKVKIGVCKGKKLWNKKEDIKSRDIDRDSKRELSNR
jgi:SsrA-binding protein